MGELYAELLGSVLQEYEEHMVCATYSILQKSSCVQSSGLPYFNFAVYTE